jgi:cell division septum initiation protein DivIVA
LRGDRSSPSCRSARRFIHKSLADAKRDREEAEARLKEYAAKIQPHAPSRPRIVDEARRDAERLREDLKQRARTEADAMIQNAERQISLQNPAGDPGNPARSRRSCPWRSPQKFIQRNLTKEDNQRSSTKRSGRLDREGMNPKHWVPARRPCSPPYSLVM